MDINLKITLTTEQLKDFCEALGWDNTSPKTKQQFLKAHLKDHIGKIIKSERLQTLEREQRTALKSLAEVTDTENLSILVD